MPELAIGSTFAGHVIRGVAGRGGMGVVYRALHVSLKREVALKVVGSTDDELRARFRREAEVAASLQHPHVVPVFDAGEEDGRLYVTMRYVDGHDLARLIALETRLAPARAARLVAHVAGALDAAHARGVVHRDVKPANVLVDRADGEESALLTDFGLTKTLDAETALTATGTLVGSFDYTAPEQLTDAPVDARTDVYGLGCVLFQALTGRVPFPSDTLGEKLRAHIDHPPPAVSVFVPEAPAALDDVIGRALAKAPDERYASAGELGAAAVAAAAGDAPAPRRRALTRRAPGALPPGLATDGRFAGRDAELAPLVVRYERAAAGTPQFVVLEGEAGAGKTRLAAELARRAHERGATVLHGRSDAESLVPYQPFVAALQHYFAQRETLEAPAELEPELRELARFVPALRRHTRSEPLAEDPRLQRRRLFEAVERVLAFAARERPLVVVLDDLQWADPSTALLLEHLLEEPPAARLLVIGTRREGGPALAGAERIALPGLDREATRALAGDSADESFVRRLYDRTEGNPLFIVEILRDTGGIPQGVKELLEGRLARLSDGARGVLKTAAVVGREFRLEVLESLLDAPALPALEEAAAKGLIAEVPDDADRFRFVHELVRELLYEDQSASRRVRLHHRIATALERLEVAAGPAELAYHYVASRHLDREGKAVEYAVRAGEQALRGLAYEDAAEHYARALERGAALPARRRTELLLALGGARLRAGDASAAATFEDAAALARRERAPDLLAEAALGYAAPYAQGSGIDHRAVALLEEALAACPDDPRLPARLANVLHFAGLARRVDELTRRALAAAQRGGDPAALAAALEARHTALYHVAHLDERLRISQELLVLAQRTGERELEALARHHRTYDLIEAGEMEAAGSERRALAWLAEALRQPAARHFVARWDLLWALMADDRAEAERLTEHVHALARRALAREADMEHAAHRLQLAYRARAFGAQVATLATEAERSPHLTVLRPALALGYLQAGDAEAARAQLEQVGVEAIPRDTLWFGAICVLAEVAAGLEDRERSRELYELILGYRERNVMLGMAGCWGSAERFLGLLARALGDDAAAGAHFETALVRNAAGGIVSAVRMINEDLHPAALAPTQISG
ncbi:MAG TPA: AAA family ATPase [Solirubrobacter sp.]|nr:AAA family ATPase [Solirubrobacter sp.]